MGALGAAGLCMILLLLGTSLDLLSVSPWVGRGLGAVTLELGALAWLGLTLLCASTLGGYLAAGMRKRMAGMRERRARWCDTVHGLGAWAVAMLGTTALLAGSLGGLVNADTRSTVYARPFAQQFDSTASMPWLLVLILLCALAAGCTAALTGRLRDR